MKVSVETPLIKITGEEEDSRTHSSVEDVMEKTVETALNAHNKLVEMNNKIDPSLKYHRGLKINP